ncbi:hypothetical protein TGVAND_252890 [Toxoplasma gondii VAND]|uniref:Uncharacterized protein n=1 Tax=Toxoplasma gondii VAND TaxID=933077 RepID=A0A086Q1J8_TOXGO|nr:hypothetical protein TGVAND_252890 [Toxoplasma gondii VAND]
MPVLSGLCPAFNQQLVSPPFPQFPHPDLFPAFLSTTMASPTPPPSSAVSPSVPANSSSASPSASSSLSVSSASSSSPFPPLEDPQLLRMLSEPQSTPATGVLSTGASGKKQQSLLSEEAAEALRAAICAAVKLRPANPAQFVSAMLFNKSGFSRQ